MKVDIGTCEVKMSAPTDTMIPPPVLAKSSPLGKPIYSCCQSWGVRIMIFSAVQEITFTLKCMNLICICILLPSPSANFPFWHGTQGATKWMSGFVSEHILVMSKIPPLAFLILVSHNFHKKNSLPMYSISSFSKAVVPLVRWKS
jgi:hypothetical protein